MIERWTSAPLPLQVGAGGFSRVDLEFEGVEHSGPSFTVLVYLNNPNVPEDAGRDEAQNFAAGFTVFAHGDCWGALGHCEPRREPVSVFDLRPEHPLTPANFTLDVTDAVTRLVVQGPIENLRVTTLVSAADARAERLLRFEMLTLVVYEAVSAVV